MGYDDLKIDEENKQTEDIEDEMSDEEIEELEEFKKAKQARMGERKYPSRPLAMPQIPIVPKQTQRPIINGGEQVMEEEPIERREEKREETRGRPKGTFKHGIPILEYKKQHRQPQLKQVNPPKQEESESKTEEKEEEEMARTNSPDETANINLQDILVRINNAMNALETRITRIESALFRTMQ